MTYPKIGSLNLTRRWKHSELRGGEWRGKNNNNKTFMTSWPSQLRLHSTSLRFTLYFFKSIRRERNLAPNWKHWVGILRRRRMLFTAADCLMFRLGDRFTFTWNRSNLKSHSPSSSPVPILHSVERGRVWNVESTLSSLLSPNPVYPNPYSPAPPFTKPPLYLFRQIVSS